MEGYDFKVVTLNLWRQVEMFRASARWAEELHVYGFRVPGK